MGGDEKADFNVYNLRELFGKSRKVERYNLYYENRCQLIHKMALNYETALKIIPEFNGDSKNLHTFLFACNSVYDMLKDTEYNKFLNLVKTKLNGAAYDVVKHNTFATWDDLKNELNLQFDFTRTVPEIQAELYKIRQSRNESVREYAMRVNKLLSELNEASSNSVGHGNSAVYTKLNEHTALKTFQDGLRDPIRIVVKACRFNKLREAIAQACEEELSSQGTSTSQFLQTNSKPYNVNNNPIKCFKCNKLGHTSKNCFFNPNGSSNNNYRNYPNHSIKTVCAYCRMSGHILQNCFRKQQADSRWLKQNQNQGQNLPSTSENHCSQSENFSRLGQDHQNQTVRAKDLKS